MTTKLGVLNLVSPLGLLLIGTMSAQAGILVDYDDPTMTNRENRAPVAIWRIASLEADAINRLHNEGYQSIKVTPGPRQTKRVVACRENRREHLVVSQSGNIRKISNLGTCLKKRYDTLTTASIAKKPKSKKATRAPHANFAANLGTMIVSTETQCIQGQLIRVDLNGFGKSIGKKRVGVCSYFSKVDEHKTLLTTASTNSRAPKFNPHKQTVAAKMMMKLSGYEKVKVLGATPTATAIEACKSGELNYIKLDPNGALLRQSNIGRCQANSNRTANQPTVAKTVELCAGRKLMSLDMGSNGQVLRTNRIGHCNGNFDQITTATIPGVSAPRLTPKHALAPHRKMLRAKGYNRIEFTDRSAPQFTATACHGEKKMRINMRSSGFITQVSRIDGTCSIAKPLPKADPMPMAAISPRMTARQQEILSKRRNIVTDLLFSGYKRISISGKTGNLTTATVCKAEKKLRLDLNASGNVIRRSRVGTCAHRQYDTMSTAAIPAFRKMPYQPSKAAIKNNLILSGYKRIKFKKFGTQIRTVEACKFNKRMRLDMDTSGTVITRSRIGSCSKPRFDNKPNYDTMTTAAIPAQRKTPYQPSKAAIRNGLILSGYKRIKIKGFGSQLKTAEACRQEKMMRLDLNAQGNVIRRSRIGTCKTRRYDNVTTAAIPAQRKTPYQPSKAAIRNGLILSGYKRIKIKGFGAQLKTAEACKSEKRMRLDLNASGNVIRRSRIGTCAQPRFDNMTTAAIPAQRKTPYQPSKAAIRNGLILSGYKRIKIKGFGSQLKTAEACRQEKMMRLDLNAQGNVIRRSRIGTCKQPRFDNVTTAAIPAFRKMPYQPSKAAIKNNLILSGYKRIKFKKFGTQIRTVEACKFNKRMRLDMDTSGTVITRSRIGSCSKPRFDNKPNYDTMTTAAIPAQRKTPYQPSKAAIRNGLILSGYKRIKIKGFGSQLKTAEACKQEKMMRLDLNAQGNVIRRSRIGTCKTRRYDNVTTAAIRTTPRHEVKAKPLAKTSSIAIKTLRNTMMLSGYSNIAIKAKGKTAFTADACRKEKRMRLDADKAGNIIRTSRIGYCAKLRFDDLTTAGIPMANVAHQTPHKFMKPMRNLLRSKGFERIRFTDRTAPLYKATVCQGDKQMRVELRSSGYINRVSRIGDCSQPKPQPASDMMPTAAIAPTQAISQKQRASAILKAKSTLALAGYTNIIVKAAGKKAFTANACRQAKQMRMDIDTNGDIIRTSRIGHCVKQNDILTTAALPGANSTQQTPKQVLAPLRKMLRAKGYNRMTFTDRTAPYYQVTACIGDKQMRIDMRDSGYIFKTSRIGTCSMVSPQPEEAKPATVVETPKQTERFRVANLTTIVSDAAPLPMPKPAMASACSSLIKTQLQKEIVFFRAGGTRISSQTRKQLNFVADMIKGCDSKKVVIGGYTDTDGSSHLNRKIGHGRAKAVMQYLMKRGISRKQLSPVSFGATNPIAPNTTAENKAKNRRVQFWVF